MLLQIGKCSVSCRRAFYKKNNKQTKKKKNKQKNPQKQKTKTRCWCTYTDEKISGVGVNYQMLSKMVFRIDIKVHVACIAIAEKRMHNPR